MQLARVAWYAKRFRSTIFPQRQSFEVATAVDFPTCFYAASDTRSHPKYGARACLQEVTVAHGSWPMLRLGRPDLRSR